MIPVFFEFGPIHIYSYGFTIALGVLLALWLMQRNAPASGFTRDQAYDFVFISVISGFIGARLFYVLQHPAEFSHNPLEIFALWEGGLIFYGGLVLGFAVLWAYARKNKITFAAMMDFILPYGALVHAFGRLGCFFNGCCYGKACDLPWAVRFPDMVERVHPAQLYEAAANLAIFAFLLGLYRRRPPQGTVMSSYLILYGAVRFAVESVRSGNPGWILTWNQWISVGMITAGLFLIRNFKKNTEHSEK